MNVLALDLGTKTGWALRENGRIESGVQVFDVKRGESPGMRYLAFNRWLGIMLVPHVATYHGSADARCTKAVELVVYELPHLRGGAAATILAGFETRVHEHCAVQGIDHHAVHTATLKKFVTGSGRGDKVAMFAAARKRGWPVNQTESEDEVDAICLLHYALAELIVPEPR